MRQFMFKILAVGVVLGAIGGSVFAMDVNQKTTTVESNIVTPIQSDMTSSDMMVRFADIEVYPEYWDAYLAAVREVGEVSVKTEPGVVIIYPTRLKNDSHKVRIMEIYRNKEAYDKHIQSAHFQTYKQGTLHMVKDLELVDVNPLSEELFSLVFAKASMPVEETHP